MSLRVRISCISCLYCISLMTADMAAVNGHSVSSTGGPSYETKRPVQVKPPAVGMFNPTSVEGVVDQFKLWQTGATLKVCFFPAASDLKKFVVEAVNAMVQDMNLRMDFGQAPGYHACAPGPVSQIRIAFDPTAGNWSYVGTDSMRVSLNEASMNIGDAALMSSTRIGPDRIRAIVFHEFGHAFALQHEHQSPVANCEKEFNWPKIYSAFLRDYGWDKKKVDDNLRTLQRSPRLRVTDYDPKSIMHYYFPEWMYLQGKNSKCFVQENVVLSAADEKILKASYPASGVSQIEEINRRGEFSKTILDKLNLNSEQAAWTKNMVEDAASQAAPGYHFVLTVNQGVCANWLGDFSVGSGSIVINCVDANGNIIVNPMK